MNYIDSPSVNVIHEPDFDLQGVFMLSVSCIFELGLVLGFLVAFAWFHRD